MNLFSAIMGQLGTRSAAAHETKVVIGQEGQTLRLRSGLREGVCRPRNHKWWATLPPAFPAEAGIHL